MGLKEHHLKCKENLRCVQHVLSSCGMQCLQLNISLGFARCCALWRRRGHTSCCPPHEPVHRPPPV
uniref:Uncharacterized protein n=1 Tax=Arundo donax TaxID=35708 RepID=A0A0A9DL92_ARUDO